MIQTKMNVIACVMLLMFAAVIQCRNMDVDTNDIDNGDEDDGEFDCDFVYTNCAHNICEHQQIVMIHGLFSFKINLIFRSCDRRILSGRAIVHRWSWL